MMMGNKAKQVVLTVFSTGVLLLGSTAACEALSLDGVPFPQEHGTAVQHAVMRHDEERFIGRLSASARLMAQNPLLPLTATLLFLTESNL
ncbi:MAG: hypothetical protein SOU94_01740 [Acidaminococcus sp.]|uniref:Lipoprotein n=1 Tax=Acidaminococcus intestini TaxID=187327 RepID=A0A943ELL2_9FIRM|nr:hypothetical protein [Acidaminococcus sp.]MBS5520620.1 hypothetical protein [Acidaminococcus intestini]MDY2738537.1 hypothetical protein [Acidaminococcus sp.]